MTHEWKIEKPQILISVTGGAKSFRLKPRLRDMFENGLRKVLYSFIFGFEPLRFARLFDLKILNLRCKSDCVFLSCHIRGLE